MFAGKRNACFLHLCNQKYKRKKILDKTIYLLVIYYRNSAHFGSLSEQGTGINTFMS